MELEHSAKGTTWGKHKYIRIENGRYIYSESAGKKGSPGMNRITYGSGTSKSRAATVAEIHNFLKGIKLTRRSGKSSSSSKKSGSGSSGTSGGLSKEKTEKEKTSTSSKELSTDEKKMTTAPTEQVKTRDVDELYTRVLEISKQRMDDKSELPKVRAKQQELEKRKKLKHMEKIFSSDLDKPSLEDLFLEHSRKGSTWSKHKYIRKEGNRYIYKEPTGKRRKKKNDGNPYDDWAEGRYGTDENGNPWYDQTTYDSWLLRKKIYDFLAGNPRKGSEYVPEYEGKVDPKTGKKVFTSTGRKVYHPTFNPNRSYYIWDEVKRAKKKRT